MKGIVCVLNSFGHEHYPSNSLDQNNSAHVWGDFPSLYSRFYKVIMLVSTNATGEGKNASAILDVRLHL
jgi:hypothetical protein